MLIQKSRRLFTARTINSLAVFSERRRKQSAGFNDSVHRHRTQHIRDRHAHNAGSPTVPMQRRMRMPDRHRGDPIGNSRRISGSTLSVAAARKPTASMRAGR